MWATIVAAVTTVTAAVVLIVSSVGTSFVEEVTALSCEAEDIQDAIDLTSMDGAIINVPAGSCTWGAGEFITPSPFHTWKLRGAGSASTIITLNGGIDRAIRHPSEVTGFRFNCTSCSEVINSAINSDYDGFRIHHNIFDNQTGGHVTVINLVTSASTDPHPYGLIDHNTLINFRLLVGATLDGGLGYWANDDPWSLGSTENVVYVEDNVFTNTVDLPNCIDSNAGARYVLRFNTFECTIEAHSLQGDGNSRASRGWEIYGNDVDASVTSTFFGMFIRGGTGVVIDNVFTTDGDVTVAMDNIRSDSAGFGSPCDGDEPRDQNTAGQNGWRCRDQIGTSP